MVLVNTKIFPIRIFESVNVHGYILVRDTVRMTNRDGTHLGETESPLDLPGLPVRKREFQVQVDIRTTGRVFGVELAKAIPIPYMDTIHVACLLSDRGISVASIEGGR
jgi:hypothetical protein